jgi:hypothetical protein
LSLLSTSQDEQEIQIVFTATHRAERRSQSRSRKQDHGSALYPFSSA